MTPADDSAYRLPKIIAARRERERMAMRRDLAAGPSRREDAVLDVVCDRLLTTLRALPDEPDPAMFVEETDGTVTVRPSSPVLVRIGPQTRTRA